MKKTIKVNSTIKKILSAFFLVQVLFTGVNADANAVNDYIMSQNFPVLGSQMQVNQWLNNPNWLGVDMRYRNGLPEGVVVHETANPSDKGNPNAIWNGISYMIRHADNAFVHSFVDANNAVEIANSAYMVWGSGPQGNKRFIQTESVEVNNKYDFARELWNLANLQAQYLSTYNMRPELGKTVWSHHMVTERLGGTDHTDPDGYWADMASRFFGTTYTMNDYEWLIEHVYKPKDAAFSIGQKVQLQSFAANEANGYDVTEHRNWVGTVKAITDINVGNSIYAYHVDYGDGTGNVYVLQQDLKVAPEAKMSVGQKAQISYDANVTVDGSSLSDKRGMGVTVKSVNLKNFSSSNYEYEVEYADGTIQSHIPEQDLYPKVVDKPKYEVGQEVQITKNAFSETDGTLLASHQGKIGKITSRVFNDYGNSNFEYYLEFADGTVTRHVAEQDLTDKFKSEPTKFKVGQKVQIAEFAFSEANGYNLQNHRKWIGTVMSIVHTDISNSKYAYYIDYGDGSGNLYVLEQDINKAPDSKYALGDQAQVSYGAYTGTDGQSLINNRGQIGKVTSVDLKNYSNSNYEYTITYPDGKQSKHIPEQDLMLPNKHQ